MRIFRVDNPHTKPFAFWEWVIAEVQREHPDVIFLAEAFTRPKVMHRLAKLGFTQSYTYFTWRNTKHELTEYFTELAQGPGREYFRPNVWPNTPDILPEYLQHGGRAGVHGARCVLAATLAANYGIYGPAFELLEHEPREPGSEEYLDSEKYELRALGPRARRQPAPTSSRASTASGATTRRCRATATLRFLPIDNDQLIAYAKTTPDRGNVDRSSSSTSIRTTRRPAGSSSTSPRSASQPTQPYQVHDLLTGARFLWQGARNYVQPRSAARAGARVRACAAACAASSDFDYFL